MRARRPDEDDGCGLPYTNLIDDGVVIWRDTEGEPLFRTNTSGFYVAYVV